MNHPTLSINLSERLGLSIERVCDKDFFKKECQLCNLKWVCEKPQSIDHEPQAHFEPARKSFVKCLLGDRYPTFSRICHCNQPGLVHNYIIRHIDTDQYFILGSECVERLDENALSRICQTCEKKHNGKSSFTHCKSCREKCRSCNKYHSFNADCKRTNTKEYKLWRSTLSKREEDRIAYFEKRSKEKLEKERIAALEKLAREKLAEERLRIIEEQLKLVEEERLENLRKKQEEYEEARRQYRRQRNIELVQDDIDRFGEVVRTVRSNCRKCDICKYIHSEQFCVDQMIPAGRYFGKTYKQISQIDINYLRAISKHQYKWLPAATRDYIKQNKALII